MVPATRLNIIIGDGGRRDLRGGVIGWRDSLSLGPILPTETLDDFLTLRLQWLTSLAPLTVEHWSATAHGLSAHLHTPHEWSELVYWSDYSLDSILTLLSLASFTGHLWADRIKVILTSAGRWQESSYSDAIAISDDILSQIVEIWHSLACSEPAELIRLNDRVVDPLRINNILRLLLAEYPSIDNGLSLREWNLLSFIESRQVVTTSALRRYFLNYNDVVLEHIVADLTSMPHPLLERVGGAGEHKLPENLRSLTVSVIGREVLRGAVDRVALRGIDKWVGGVHLRGHQVAWRYDRGSSRLRMTDS